MLADVMNEHLRRRLLKRMKRQSPFRMRGRVRRVTGPMLEAGGLDVEVGRACRIFMSGNTFIDAEVVGFRDDDSLIMPAGSTRGIAPGSPVQAMDGPPSIGISDALPGRVLDACGRPLDGKALPSAQNTYPILRRPPNPMNRHLIDEPMQSGVRIIDACLTMGKGQRMGLFAGPGAGKSTLLGMIARETDADIIVIALVGERGRELREFLDHTLGPDSLARCVVVVATSDMPPLLRVRAALTAMTIAEVFRDHGKHVLLLMDSLTRFLQAQREIGLMLGEPPTSKGYTPSCFSMLAELVERAGPGDGRGDISGVYAVLVEGSELADDPVADAAQAVLDGHIVLSRRMAERGHFPAIDLLRSVSRLATNLVSSDVQKAAQSLREDLALYERMEDMIHMGAYEKGSNAELDRVIGKLSAINAFRYQDARCFASIHESQDALLGLATG